MNQWFHFGPTVAFLLTWFFQSTASLKYEGGCYFPDKWQGTWFQSGIRQPVIIEESRITSKGRCLGSEGDKFLLVDDKRACYRCVVIHEKHANVLQYKETYCYGRDSLPSLCSYITGDALLYSMFRENATPVPCPFKAPFTFTYNRGYGECRSPVSNIDSCTEDTKLLLSYQACPDIPGTESIVEELQCLAAWKEGSSRYLVGKIDYIHALSNEDRYRCFVYEKLPPDTNEDVDFRIAQSGDATCNGLFSATEGSRTMTLRKASSLSKCRFLSWMTSYTHWHTLDYTTTYSFHHRDTLKITNSTSGSEMKVLCAHIKYVARNESSVVLLTHFTMGCKSGYMCMSFSRRDVHVMEVQIGSQTKRLEDACSAANFNISSQSYVTLVTTTPDTRSCPYFGKFEVNNLIRTERSANHNKAYHQPDPRYFDNYFLKISQNSVSHRSQRSKRSDQEMDCDNDGYTNLIIGCSSVDTMEFKTGCASKSSANRAYACHGRWEENGTNYLITSPVSTKLPHGARRYCFIYKESAPDMVLFSSSAVNCDRILRPGVTGELVFNVTNIGECIVASGASHPSVILLKFGLFFSIVSTLLQR